MIINMIATIHELLWNHNSFTTKLLSSSCTQKSKMKDMKYNLEQDGDILEDRRDKVLHQQTQGEEISSIN
jgi:hypothetical protein